MPQTEVEEASAPAAAPAPAPRAAAAVPHVRQAHNWDCGLACVLMALQARGGGGAPEATLGALRRACGTESVWTIDLAHLLASFGVAARFYTVNPGVNPAYVGERFYRRGWDEDWRRVERLFADAEARGIRVVRRRLGRGELAGLAGDPGCVVIVLTDKRFLAYSGDGEAAPQPQPSRGGDYTGHYIVLAGYDAREDAFVVRDPARPTGASTLGAEQLERARTAFGTDQDVLLVP